jgi:hypothetical protein
MIGSVSFVQILALINSILSTGTAVTAFSLLIHCRYTFVRPVRALSVLLGCVILWYVGDSILYRATDAEATEMWLRAQWIGIALVPAAYLHFSDNVLRTTNSFNRVHRAIVYVAYVSGFMFMGLALFSDAIVTHGVLLKSASHLNQPVILGLFHVLFRRGQRRHEWVSCARASADADLASPHDVSAAVVLPARRWRFSVSVAPAMPMPPCR